MIYQVHAGIDELVEEAADFVDFLSLKLDAYLADTGISVSTCGLYEFFTRRVAARLLELPPDLNFDVAAEDGDDNSNFPKSAPCDPSKEG